MTIEERAEALASKANECCYRSDGYEDDMKATILEHLRAVVEACAEVAEYTDIGTYSAIEHALHIAQQIRREVGQ